MEDFVRGLYRVFLVLKGLVFNGEGYWIFNDYWMKDQNQIFLNFVKFQKFRYEKEILIIFIEKLLEVSND